MLLGAYPRESPSQQGLQLRPEMILVCIPVVLYRHSRQIMGHAMLVAWTVHRNVTGSRSSGSSLAIKVHMRASSRSHASSEQASPDVCESTGTRTWQRAHQAM